MHTVLIFFATLGAVVCFCFAVLFGAIAIIVKFENKAAAARSVAHEQARRRLVCTGCYTSPCICICKNHGARLRGAA